MAVVAAIALASCGGSGKASTSATKANDATTTASDGATASTDAPSDSKTTSADSGGSNNGGSAGNAGLPSNFPSDRIPVPNDVTITNSTSVDGGETMTYLVTFTTGKGVNAITDYYASALKDRGWHQIVQTNSGDSYFAGYSRNEDGSGDIVNVTAMPNSESSDKTDVSLQVGLTK